MGAIPIKGIKKRGMPKYLFLLMTAALLFSCTGKSVYDQYVKIDDRYWEKDKEYTFTFEIEDNTVPYDLVFEVRNNNLYPFQNLWIFRQEEYAGTVYKRDTVEYMLADDYGKWLGKGISVFQSSFPLINNYHFPDTGSYTFSFRQGMRNDKLPGIQEIGLRIEKVAL